MVGKVGDRNVEPPRHQTLEAGEPTPSGVPLKNLPRGAGEEAVESRPVLTEAAERAQLLLPAVVRGMHPGQPPECRWPDIHVAPVQPQLAYVLEEHPVSSSCFVAH